MRTAHATEHQLQCAVVQWASITSKQAPELELLMAIPNGGARHITVARKLKAEGVRAGVPDLFLPVMRYGFGGLWIEMKSGTGRLTPEQKQWIKRLRAQGYCAIVCNSFELAVKTIQDYLGTAVSE